jgi:hypothetical protein
VKSHQQQVVPSAGARGGTRRAGAAAFGAGGATVAVVARSRQPLNASVQPAEAADLGADAGFERGGFERRRTQRGPQALLFARHDLVAASLGGIARIGLAAAKASRR